MLNKDDRVTALAGLGDGKIEVIKHRIESSCSQFTLDNAYLYIND